MSKVAPGEQKTVSTYPLYIGTVASKAGTQCTHRIPLVIKERHLLRHDRLECGLSQTRGHLYAGRGEHVTLQHGAQASHDADAQEDIRNIVALMTHHIRIAIRQDAKEVTEEETPQRKR